MKLRKLKKYYLYTRNEVFLGFLLKNKVLLNLSYKIFRLKGFIHSIKDVPFEKKEIIEFNAAPDEHIFNPTFFKRKDSHVFLARKVDKTLKRMLVGGQVNECYEPLSAISPVKVSEADEFSISWPADPRLFSASKRVLGVFNTGHSESPNRNFLFELDQTGRSISSLKEIVKLDRRAIEKNWGFFEYENEVYAVYSISPWVIVKLEKDVYDSSIINAKEVHRINWNSHLFEENFGELRGGASPFLYRGNFYYITQSHIKTFLGKIYFGSMIEFESKPPFRIKKVSSTPVFKLTKDEYLMQPEARLNKTLCSALYPSSVNLESCDSRITLGYGINDYRVGVRTYKFDLLLKQLSKVDFIN